MMNRRKMLGVAGASGVALAMGTFLVGCKQSASDWIKIVIDELGAILPVLEQVVPGSSKIVAKALEVAKAVQHALENKDPNVVVFLEQLVAPEGLINQIIGTLGGISDPKTKAIVAGSLVLISTALRLIAMNLTQAPAVMIRMARSAHPKAATTVEKAASQGTLNKLLSEAKF